MTNLTDKEIKIRGTRFGGNVAVADYEDPRMFGLKVDYQW